MANNRNDFKKISFRDAAIVTTSYVTAAASNPEDADDAVDIYGYNQLVLYVPITIGSLDSVEIKIELSPDNGSNWFQETTDASPSSGAIVESVVIRQFTASGNYRIPIPISDRRVRVSVKGTGTVTGSSVGVSGVIS